MFDNNVKANPEQQQKNQEQNSKQRKDDTKLGGLIMILIV